MEGPSSRIVAQASVAICVTDRDGRSLTLRRMGALDRLRLFKAIGPTLAQNPPYLGMAMLAASVIAIEDVPVPPPCSEAQVEALISRLGDVGISAVAEGLPGDAMPSTEATPGGLAGN